MQERVSFKVNQIQREIIEGIESFISSSWTVQERPDYNSAGKSGVEAKIAGQTVFKVNKGAKGVKVTFNNGCSYLIEPENETVSIRDSLSVAANRFSKSLE